MNFICREANKMGVLCNGISILQDKDGVVVARIKSNANSFIIKYFQNEEFKREITNYRLLSSLHIPTIKVIAATDSAILLEDIDYSAVYRLGTECDMDDPAVAKCIARWYRQLHCQGYDYVALYGAELYDESDFFTLENIKVIKENTGTQNAASWITLEQHFNAIYEMLQSRKKTLTYNDFYYTNMVVAKDRSSALMFDYNLLGKGYIYSDLRNVTSMLSPKVQNVFLTEYGYFDPLEAALDDVVGLVVSLHNACRRKDFPIWATSLIEDVNTTLDPKIQHLIDLY